MDYKLRKIAKTPGGGYDILEDAPFPVKRVYYISNVEKGMRRGFHAHKTLRQLLSCPYGCIRITLDDGHCREEVVLDAPEKVLELAPGLWREMEWLVSGSVLCVMASEYYDEDDYIRSYPAFLEYAAQKASKGEESFAIPSDQNQDESRA